MKYFLSTHKIEIVYIIAILLAVLFSKIAYASTDIPLEEPVIVVETDSEEVESINNEEIKTSSEEKLDPVEDEEKALSPSSTVVEDEENVESKTSDKENSKDISSVVVSHDVDSPATSGEDEEIYLLKVIATLLLVSVFCSCLIIGFMLSKNIFGWMK